MSGATPSSGSTLAAMLFSARSIASSRWWLATGAPVGHGLGATPAILPVTPAPRYGPY